NARMSDRRRARRPPARRGAAEAQAPAPALAARGAGAARETRGGGRGCVVLASQGLWPCPATPLERRAESDALCALGIHRHWRAGSSPSLNCRSIQGHAFVAKSPIEP